MILIESGKQNDLKLFSNVRQMKQKFGPSFEACYFLRKRMKFQSMTNQVEMRRIPFSIFR